MSESKFPWFSVPEGRPSYLSEFTPLYTQELPEMSEKLRTAYRLFLDPSFESVVGFRKIVPQLLPEELGGLWGLRLDVARQDILGQYEPGREGGTGSLIIGVYSHQMASTIRDTERCDSGGNPVRVVRENTSEFREITAVVAAKTQVFHEVVGGFEPESDPAQRILNARDEAIEHLTVQRMRQDAELTQLHPSVFPDFSTLE